MLFRPLQVLFATSLIPVTTALQSIYFATLASSGGYVCSEIFPLKSLIARHILISVPWMSSRLAILAYDLQIDRFEQNFLLAFFLDSNPCTDGASFGYLPVGFDNCNQDMTILGHENITFTGSKSYT